MSSTDIQQQVILNAAKLAEEISPWVYLLISALLIAGAIIRARSAHFFFDRAWRFIGGGPVKDTDLIQVWNTIRDLEGFRFKTGINFKTKESFSNTLKWLETHEMTITDLSFARAWIKDRPLEIKKPHIPSIKALAWCLSIVFIPMATLTTFIAVQPYVLLTVKSTNLAFWTDGTTAKNFIFNSNNHTFKITEKDCNSNIHGLSEEDKTVICLAISPSSKDKISSSLMEQRMIAAYLIFICLLITIPAIRLLAQARMASKFYELLNPDPAP